MSRPPAFRRDDVLAAVRGEGPVAGGLRAEVALMPEAPTAHDLVASGLDLRHLKGLAGGLPDTADVRRRRRLFALGQVDAVRFFLERSCGRSLGCLLQTVQVLASVDDERERCGRLLAMGGPDGHFAPVPRATYAASVLHDLPHFGREPVHPEVAGLLLSTALYAAVGPARYARDLASEWSDAVVASQAALGELCVAEGHMTPSEALRSEDLLASVRFDAATVLGAMLHVPVSDWRRRHLPYVHGAGEDRSLRIVVGTRGDLFRAFARAFGDPDPSWTIRPGFAPAPAWL